MRGAAVALVAFGAYLALKRLLFAIIVSNFDAAFRNWVDIGEGHSASRGLAMIVIGVALGLASRRVARWAIVPPQAGCAGCGYPEAAGGVCPECGMKQD